MYVHLLIEKIYCLSLLSSSNTWLSNAAFFSLITIALSIILLILSVLCCKIFIPACVKTIFVSLLSLSEVTRFTSFFVSSLSIILGILELFSIILQAISLTQICSGCLPFNILSTLYCSCVKPYSFNSLLITVLSHHAVYKIFSAALCALFLNLLLLIASSNFIPMQMYVYTSNFAKIKPRSVAYNNLFS